MPGPSPAPSKTLRMLLGGGAALVSLAGFVWAGVHAWAAIAFGRIPPPAELDSSRRLPMRSSGAVLELERIVRLDPENGVIRKRLASELAQGGDFARALAEVRQAQRTANTPDGLLLIADLLDKLDRTEEGAAQIGDAVALNPDSPQSNDLRLRLLGRMMAKAKAASAQSGSSGGRESGYREAHRLFALAARDWTVRAPNDRNSYLFYANDCVGPPVFALQAYRLFLIGLSSAPGMDLYRRTMIEPRDAIGTIRQIIDYQFAKPYRGIFAEPNPAAPPGAAP